VLVAIPAAALLLAFDEQRYYRSVQEDEWLEWASVWSFLAAAVVAAALAVRELRLRSPRWWFALGLAGFCFWVAMEEISWGQRLLGYRPPAYFLEHNYQQELNLHNVVSTDLRQLALSAVILGYGVALPLALRVPRLGAWLERLGVFGPPLGLAPAFLGTFLLYQSYPWKFSGEWVEWMLGLGFLFGLLLSDPVARTSALRLAAAWGLVMLAGSACAAVSGARRDGRPENRDAARVEIETLAADFLAARVPSPCGLHQRLYTFVEAGDVDALRTGSYAAQVERGLPEERAAFFLDPWNSPYWIRDICADEGQRRRIAIYSLGANRMRESDAWSFAGDDVGHVVFEAAPE
jgi:hypothetical protein